MISLLKDVWTQYTQDIITEIILDTIITKQISNQNWNFIDVIYFFWSLSSRILLLFDKLRMYHIPFTRIEIRGSASKILITSYTRRIKDVKCVRYIYAFSLSLFLPRYRFSSKRPANKRVLFLFFLSFFLVFHPTTSTRLRIARSAREMCTAFVLSNGVYTLVCVCFRVYVNVCERARTRARRRRRDCV